MKVITDMTQFPWKSQLPCSNIQKKKNKIKVETERHPKAILSSQHSPGGHHKTWTRKWLSGLDTYLQAWEPELDPQNEVQLLVS